MATHAQIASNLQNLQATNGWDAVFAMNLKQANALLFQQYLEHGAPTSAKHLRVMLDTGGPQGYAIVDFELGPPELTFQAGSSHALLEMELIKGVLITFNPAENCIEQAAWVQPKESKLSGALELAKVTGEVNEVGKVVLDLGASAYVPAIAGVDPNSEMNKQIGLAIQTFFAANSTTFTLGAVAQGNVPAALTPTYFQFATQSTAQESCVLLLIQTNGQPGAPGPLPAYPIPDGRTAALLIGEETLFAGALVERLNKAFQFSQGKFERRKDSEGWVATAIGGSVSFGQIGQRLNEQDCSWSEGPVAFPLNPSFVVKRTTTGLQADWTPVSSQAWLRQYLVLTLGNPNSGTPGRTFWITSEPKKLTLSISYSWHGEPKIDPITDIVSFAANSIGTKCELSKKSNTSAYSWWDMCSVYIPNQITNTVLSTLKENLDKAFKLVDINTFALASLLFPSGHTVRLTDVALTKDLYLTGHLQQPIAVAPSDSLVAPGGFIQFTASGADGLQHADILWEINPRIGSISASGLYTAPATLSSAELIVITAVDKNNAGSTGRALALVSQSPAAQGIAVSPAKSLVTPDQSVRLSASDSSGKHVNVTWTLSPNVGEIVNGWDPSFSVYKAPNTLTDAIRVTAHATGVANPALKGFTVIQVVPTNSLQVQPDNPAVKLSASVALTATTTANNASAIRWVVYPTGAGVIEFDQDDPSKATYTAPASVPPESDRAHVLAYLVDDEGAGMGSATITLIP